MKLITAIVDGACWRNPGPTGIGVVLHKGDRVGPVLAAFGEYTGRGTNNVAEYKAVIRGAMQALQLGARELVVLTDSKLVRRQVRGEWRVHKQHLRSLCNEARARLDKFEKWELVRASRGVTAPADRAATLAVEAKATVNLPIDDGAIVPPAAEQWHEFARALADDLEPAELEALRRPLDMMRERDGYRYMDALGKLWAGGFCEGHEHDEMGEAPRSAAPATGCSR